MTKLGQSAKTVCGLAWTVSRPVRLLEHPPHRVTKPLSGHIKRHYRDIQIYQPCGETISGQSRRPRQDKGSTPDQ